MPQLTVLERLRAQTSSYIKQLREEKESVRAHVTQLVTETLATQAQYIKELEAEIERLKKT